MFGTYFYNKNIRNIVILFGTVFNDISIRRTDASNVVKEEIKVPIAYGPAEKFLVRLREETDISKGKVGLTYHECHLSLLLSIMIQHES